MNCEQVQLAELRGKVGEAERNDKSRYQTRARFSTCLYFFIYCSCVRCDHYPLAGPSSAGGRESDLSANGRSRVDGLALADYHQGGNGGVAGARLLVVPAPAGRTGAQAAGDFRTSTDLV